jgi:hypothetical protein
MRPRPLAEVDTTLFKLLPYVNEADSENWQKNLFEKWAKPFVARGGRSMVGCGDGRGWVTHRKSKQIERRKFFLSLLLFCFSPVSKLWSNLTGSQMAMKKCNFQSISPSITKPARKYGLELKDNFLITDPLLLMDLW